MSVPPASPRSDDVAAVTPTELDSGARSELRSQAHHLKPVVMIGESGLTEAVLAETDRALKAHHLIKLRVFGDDREARDAIMADLCRQLGCSPVQTIGKLLIVWRAPSAEDLAVQQSKRRKPRKPLNKKKAEARSEMKRSGVKPTSRTTKPRSPVAARGSASRPAAGTRTAAGAAGPHTPSGGTKVASTRSPARGTGLSAVRPAGNHPSASRSTSTRAERLDPIAAPHRPTPAATDLRQTDRPSRPLAPAQTDTPKRVATSAPAPRTAADRAAAWFDEAPSRSTSTRPAPDRTSESKPGRSSHRPTRAEAPESTPRSVARPASTKPRSTTGSSTSATGLKKLVRLAPAKSGGGTK